MSTLCWLYNIQSAYYFLRETDLLCCYSFMVSKNALWLRKKVGLLLFVFFPIVIKFPSHLNIF